MKLIPLVNKSLAIIVLSCSGFYCYATGSVNININGKVIASPCTAGDVTVPLGDIQATDLVNADSGSTMVAFDLPLTNCPLGTTSVKATFTGEADTDTTRWKNKAESPATNTSVEVSDQTGGELISNASTRTATVNAGSATFKLQARAYTATGSVTPGGVTANILVSFEYQ